MIKKWQKGNLMGQVSPPFQLREEQLERRGRGRIKGGEYQQEVGSRKFTNKNKREKTVRAKTCVSPFVTQEIDFYQSKCQFLLSLLLITYLIFLL